MAIIEKQASSLSEIFAAAKAIRALWNPHRDAPEEIWFRGQTKRSYPLLPSLYRPDALDFGYDEPTISHVFANLGLPYATQRPATDWEWYFVSRHHGLPTRLLDWTESLVAGVYFAVEGFWRSLDKRDLPDCLSSPSTPLWDKESPTVWVIDAGSVNLFSHKQDVLFGAHREEIISYLPRFLYEPTKAGQLEAKSPIALYPPRQTARIIAQQGMFTLHGRDQTGLEALADAHDPDGLLKIGCIELDRNSLPWIVEELILAGVTRLALFPDLDAVAEHIKWHYRD